MPNPVEFKVRTVDDRELIVSTVPLLFDHAQPMLPQILEIVSIASRDLVAMIASGKIDLKADTLDPNTVASIFPSLQNLAAYLDGKLEKLAPKLLATTRVAAPTRTPTGEEGELEWHEMQKLSDRNYIFNEYPEIYLQVVFHAGRVTFGRFFPKSLRRGKPGQESSSKTS